MLTQRKRQVDCYCICVSAGSGAASCEGLAIVGQTGGKPVKLHLLTGGERMLAKVGAKEYPGLRGREGERIRISWKEEDVQLLDP